MKKFLFLQIFFVLSLTISCETSSYGAGNFSKHYNKGIEFYKQGKYDQAGISFEEALKIKPNDVYALYGLGNTYYCKAKYDEAVKIYARAININPDYAKVHYSLSLAYSKLGMTREAEKEKTTFRQLSQGGKGSKTSKTHAKTLSHAPKKTLHQKKHVETHTKQETKTSTHAPGKDESKHVETHTKHEKKAPTHTTHAPSGHQEGKEKTAHEVHKAPAKRSSTESDSIFKGYTGETHKADERVFTKKYQGTYGIPKSSFGNIKLYIQKKWYESGLNKIWICTAGYILATQIWLCAVTFFVLIIWRIRAKA
ncbi:MAG: tetratricopeptide repeat protein [Candidatus Scalindua sp.]